MCFMDRFCQCEEVPHFNSHPRRLLAQRIHPQVNAHDSITDTETDGDGKEMQWSRNEVAFTSNRKLSALAGNPEGQRPRGYRHSLRIRDLENQARL